MNNFTIVNDLRQRRREERSLIRGKKREQERCDHEEIEMYRSRKDAQKFFKNVKPGVSSCRDERGNLVIDVQGVLSL